MPPGRSTKWRTRRAADRRQQGRWVRAHPRRPRRKSMTQYTEDRPHARRAVVRVLLLAAFSAATLTQAQANGAPDSVSGAVPDSVMPTPAPLPPPPTIAETARERPPFAAGISINALLRR